MFSVIQQTHTAIYIIPALTVDLKFGIVPSYAVWQCKNCIATHKIKSQKTKNAAGVLGFIQRI